MARYAVTQSQYTPYSFDNLWKSSEYLTQQHQLAAANFAALDAQAAPLVKLQNNPIDSAEAAVVGDYMNQLDIAANKFSKFGLKGGAFQDFINLNRNYTKTIKPIETALTQRQALATVYNELYTKDNSIQFVRKPTDIALSEFMAGTVTPEFISGEDIKKEVSMIAAKFAAQYNGTTKKPLDADYLAFIHKYGLDPKEIQAQLTGDANTDLNIVINSVLNAHPTYNKLNDVGKEAIRQYAQLGAYQAIGTSQPQVQDNKNIARAQLQLERDQAQFMKDMYQAQIGQVPEIPTYHQKIASAKALTREAQELSAKKEALNNARNLYHKYPKSFQLQNIPKDIRDEVHKIIKENETTYKQSISWERAFQLYQNKLDVDYNKVVSIKDAYAIPATAPYYKSILDGFFTGSNSSQTVRDIKTKDNVLIGDLLQPTSGVTLEELYDKVIIKYDPTMSEEGFIISIPTINKSKNHQVTYTDYEFPFNKMINSSMFDSIQQDVQTTKNTYSGLELQDKLGRLYPMYINSFMDQYRTNEGQERLNNQEKPETPKKPTKF